MSENDVNLARLDRNLVTALHALLEHGSVSKIAASVGRTQSAMSHSLSRLRDHFQDALLVREGWEMHPTPLAKALRAKVTDTAKAIDALVANEPAFDPLTSRRRITEATPDLCAPLMVPLIAKVAQDARR